MNILIPYVRLRVETVNAVEQEWAEPKLVDTGAAPEAYWQALADEWEKAETFIVLEGDKIPYPGVLRSLWECPQQWCLNRVPMQGTDVAAPYPSLSCVKFGKDMLQLSPHILEDAGELDLGYGPKHWNRLDLAVAGLLENEGWKPHWHAGLVEHLHYEPVTDAVRKQ